MNYDQPRQLQSGPFAGKWNYTSMNDGRVHAIGKCWEHRDEYAHDTEDGARACYREYQRSKVTLDARFGDWSGCRFRVAPDRPICDKPTKTGADARDGFHVEPLCEEHLNLECAYIALGLDGPVAGDSIHS
jgi:hypothetical protein